MRTDQVKVRLKGGTEVVHWMFDGQRFADVPSTAMSRATRKLQRVFVYLSGKRSIGSTGGSHFTLIIYNNDTRYTFLLFLKHKSDVAQKL